jgi:hypothetical protein
MHHFYHPLSSPQLNQLFLNKLKLTHHLYVQVNVKDMIQAKIFFEISSTKNKLSLHYNNTILDDPE